MLAFSACRSPEDPNEDQTSYTVGGVTAAVDSVPGSGASARNAAIDPNDLAAGGTHSGTRTSAGGYGNSGTRTSTTRKKLAVDNVMDCEETRPAVASRHIEAECALGDAASCADTQGGQVGTQLERDGKTVGYIEGGDQLYYADVRMDGVRRLKFRYAKGVDGLRSASRALASLYRAQVKCCDLIALRARQPSPTGYAVTGAVLV